MWGVMQSEGAAKALRFEREFPQGVEKLWAALTTAERIAAWMCADAEIDPRVGGRYFLAFRNFSHTMEGRITRLEKPRLLEYTWTEDAARGHSLVRWELSAAGAGCRLVLTHTLLAGGDARDFASGWHWHLDALAVAAGGGSAMWREAEWRALREQYGERLDAA